MNKETRIREIIYDNLLDDITSVEANRHILSDFDLDVSDEDIQICIDSLLENMCDQSYYSKIGA